MSTVEEAAKLDAAAFKSLERSFRGELVRPGIPSTRSTAGTVTAT